MAPLVGSLLAHIFIIYYRQTIRLEKQIHLNAHLSVEHLNALSNATINV